MPPPVSCSASTLKCQLLEGGCVCPFRPGTAWRVVVVQQTYDRRTPAAQATPSKQTGRIQSTPTLRLEPKPRLPQQRPPIPPRSDPHRDLTHRSCTEPFSGWNGLTRKCSREGEAASGLKEYFRVGRSGSSASVAVVRVAAGRVRGFPGGGWSGAGSRSRTARPLSLGSG